MFWVWLHVCCHGESWGGQKNSQNIFPQYSYQHLQSYILAFLSFYQVFLHKTFPIVSLISTFIFHHFNLCSCLEKQFSFKFWNNVLTNICDQFCSIRCDFHHFAPAQIFKYIQTGKSLKKRTTSKLFDVVTEGLSALFAIYLGKS